MEVMMQLMQCALLQGSVIDTSLVQAANKTLSSLNMQLKNTLPKSMCHLPPSTAWQLPHTQ